MTGLKQSYAPDYAYRVNGQTFKTYMEAFSEWVRCQLAGDIEYVVN